MSSANFYLQVFARSREGLNVKVKIEIVRKWYKSFISQKKFAQKIWFSFSDVNYHHEQKRNRIIIKFNYYCIRWQLVLISFAIFWRKHFSNKLVLTLGTNDTISFLQYMKMRTISKLFKWFGLSVLQSSEFTSIRRKKDRKPWNSKQKIKNSQRNGITIDLSSVWNKNGIEYWLLMLFFSIYY